MKKINSSPDWVNFKPGYPVPFDPFRDADDFHLDQKAGQKAIDFFSSCLCHVKGEKALQPLELELWQQCIVGHLFGWKSLETDLRRFREAFIEIPRKNGKTIIGAGLSLYFLFSQPERGQEIYCCASDRSQARLLFDVAKSMILKDEDMRKRAEVLRHEVRYPARDSVFRVISSEASSKHGYSSSLVVLDELHVIADPELVHVLETSTGARREPLIVSLTTAGFDKFTICHEKYDYSRKVRDGVIRDRAFFPVVYEMPEGEDWQSPEVWENVNPNLGKSISLEYLTREAERAGESPAYEAVFKRLHLNVWTDAESPFISLRDWDKCRGPVPDLRGRRCYGGLDLSSTQDLTAFSLCFPPEGEEPFYLLSWSWIPEDAMRSQRKRPYLEWVNSGHLMKIPGAVIDYSFVIEKILQLKAEYDLQGVLFDRWGSEHVRQALESEGVEMIQHGQGYKDQSPPTKEFLKLILSQKIQHDGNPVLRWCISNLVVEIDSAGNVKPSRRRSTEKIDLAVSGIMALNGCLVNPVEPPFQSVYEGKSVEQIMERMWL